MQANNHILYIINRIITIHYNWSYILPLFLTTEEKPRNSQPGSNIQLLHKLQHWLVVHFLLYTLTIIDTAWRGILLETKDSGAQCKGEMHIYARIAFSFCLAWDPCWNSCLNLQLICFSVLNRFNRTFSYSHQSVFNIQSLLTWHIQ